MRGIIFTEFLEMMEERFGPAIADQVIAGAQSSGVYTAVGNYDAREFLRLLMTLSKETGIPGHTLQFAFGERIFALFARNYGAFFAEAPDALSFLGSIENYIHVEVRKLYPDAELPVFTYPERSADHMVMEYHSERPMSHFAHGLVCATVAYFGGGLAVEMQDIAGSGGNARFILKRNG